MYSSRKTITSAHHSYRVDGSPVTVASHAHCRRCACPYLWNFLFHADL